jgi:hypothetical protein
LGCFPAGAALPPKARNPKSSMPKQAKGFFEMLVFMPASIWLKNLLLFRKIGKTAIL